MNQVSGNFIKNNKYVNLHMSYKLKTYILQNYQFVSIDASYNAHDKGFDFVFYRKYKIAGEKVGHYAYNLFGILTWV